jgi:hypothetical protein
MDEEELLKSRVPQPKKPEPDEVKEPAWAVH